MVSRGVPLCPWVLLVIGINSPSLTLSDLLGNGINGISLVQNHTDSFNLMDGKKLRLGCAAQPMAVSGVSMQMLVY